MSTPFGALSVVIGFCAAGLIACGSGSATTTGPLGPAAVPPGSAAASPTVIGITSASPAPSPPSSAAGGGGIPSRHRSLTVADHGASVRLRVGQIVTITLTSGGLMWDIPRASGTVVRRISASGGYPARGPAVAVFRAVRPGQSWLTSVTDAPCLHSQPRCEILQQPWRVLIIVRSA